MIVEVEINNVVAGPSPYIVARYAKETLSWWYYGRYDTQERADEVRDTLNGNNEAAIVLKKI